MKRNKIIKYVLFFLFLFPFTINAEVCNKHDIKIEKIELNEIKGNAEEITESNHENNKINLNTKMNVIGDSITYKVILKNTSNSDYVFDQNQITKDYINYDISYEDESNIIKSGEEKIIYLQLNYQNKPQIENLSNGVYTETTQISIPLIKENKLENPITRNPYLIYLSIILISFFLVRYISKKQKFILLILISLVTTLQMVNAICTYTLDIDINIEIDMKEAIFLPGREVNVKIKQLAGTNISNPTYPFTTIDNNITSIKYSEEEPNDSEKEEKNMVSTPDSEYPIYMWFDNGTIYWWSEDKTPSLNEDASRMFCNLESLTNIDGLRKLDTSNTKTLEQIFYYATSLTNINAISNWNLLQVETIRGIFINTKINDLAPLSTWDISNIKIIKSAFQGIKTIKNIDRLKSWNTENVEDMSYLFNNCTELEDISILSIWDTKNINNLSYMLSNTSITDISSLRNWNTSKVTTLRGMFMYCTKIEDASALNDWDITNVTDFTYMFAGSQIHPEFTKLEGTWSNGTFTPTT